MRVIVDLHLIIIVSAKQIPEIFQSSDRMQKKGRREENAKSSLIFYMISLFSHHSIFCPPLMHSWPLPNSSCAARLCAEEHFYFSPLHHHHHQREQQQPTAEHRAGKSWNFAKKIRSVGYVIHKQEREGAKATKKRKEEEAKKLNFLHFSTVNSLSDYSIRVSEWETLKNEWKTGWVYIVGGSRVGAKERWLLNEEMAAQQQCSIERVYEREGRVWELKKKVGEHINLVSNSRRNNNVEIFQYSPSLHTA